MLASMRRMIMIYRSNESTYARSLTALLAKILDLFVRRIRLQVRIYLAVEEVIW